VITRVNFSGRSIPNRRLKVLLYFCFCQFFEESGVVLRFKNDLLGVAVCTVVKKSCKKSSRTCYLCVFSAFMCVFKSVCGVLDMILHTICEKISFEPPPVVRFL